MIGIYRESVTTIFSSCLAAMTKAEAILGICLDDVKKAKEITSYDQQQSIQAVLHHHVTVRGIEYEKVGGSVAQHRARG